MGPLVYFLAVLVVYLAYAFKKFNDSVVRAKHIPGPPILPFIGNGHMFLNKTAVELTKLQMDNAYKYGDFSRIFLANKLLVILGNPKDVEVLLSSQKLIDKSEEYDFAKEWFGEGLLFSTGKKWFTRRRIITPTFHFKILDQFIEVFDRNSKILVQQLAKYKNKTVDVYPLITLCALDIICETSMGVPVNAQVNSDSSYVSALRELACILNLRSVNVLLRIPMIFRLSAMGRKWQKLIKTIHCFTDSVIKKRKQELASRANDHKTDVADDDVGAKKKMAFLDVLLQATVDGKPLSDSDIREEVDTFAFAGHDTTTSAMTFCCFTLAKYPDVQTKVFEEIRNVIGDDKDKKITMQDLNNLHYLELVIKETMRLFPPVPVFSRLISEDVTINGKLIPKGASVLVAPNSMGRSSTIWKNPEEFNPERFEKDNMQGMHAYSNVVFSAGTRNCIGQKFAMLEIKSTISKLLRHYELTVEKDYELKLFLEMVLKSENGVQINFKDRIYK